MAVNRQQNPDKEKQAQKELAEIKNNPKFPKYGTPGYDFKLRWHDESKRDFLMVVDAQKKSEIMNARAKGTTVYELINQYGGIDGVTEAFADKAAKAQYGDVSDMPEMCDDDFNGLILKLQSGIDALKARQSASRKEKVVTKVTKEETVTSDKVAEGDK